MSTDYLRAVARYVLASVKDSPQFSKHAQTQALVLKNLLKGAHFNDNEVAECVRRVTAIGFPNDIGSQLVESAAAREGIEDRPSNKNTKLQNYEAFIYYLPASLWIAMQHGPAAVALKMFVRALMLLGLRRPSCPTFGMMTAIHCMLQEGETATMDKDKVVKYNTLELVKNMFRGLEKTHLPPPVYVVTLPLDVSTFVAEYPSLASEFYAQEKHGVPPLDVPMAFMIADAWPLRKPKELIRAMPMLDLGARGGLGARGPIEINEKSLMSSFMTTMMKMAQQSQVGHRGRENPLINVYEGRASLKARRPMPSMPNVSQRLISLTKPWTRQAIPTKQSLRMWSLVAPLRRSWKRCWSGALTKGKRWQ